ncbi:MAG: methylmalonyl Co-A mutase-associated GTPase MeaB [Desulfobacterales bacterium]|jgi:LAO/AO transport system kinase|nr:methylmalonyl Co-A mutase-associated GTPase MeaB [Desulfobacterales bacterium]MDD3949989.1 methylmalonyl Co-A mutase-associated GTPase MeaB [Desulfobacterales bacterium]MDD4463351.1 methylmalonyl Co-A mutase-associated GTPase MeaB [Desulfobacterales bacterium]MDY0376919.1 methylmalonyl Co-A mutase-associated GTPase MeaB [Desulfobacterales bacterium]
MLSRDPQEYVQGVLQRDKRIIAKTITLIESSLHEHQELARKIIDLLLPNTGNAVRLGVTGVPGAGKSTFIEGLGTLLVRKGHSVAVLAIDPSSKRSGGSILADKTRMEKLSAAEKAYIRPSPAGSTLGGVARKTRETMMVCEAAGYDVIIVETVGVGQSETAASSMVDFFLVLMLAGAGDEIQGIKKGVLEMADAIVVNKADGINLEKAKVARRQYESAIKLLSPASPNWSPVVRICSSLEESSFGIEEIWQEVLRHREIVTQSGELEAKRRKQALDWMWFLIEEGLHERFYGNAEIQKMLPKISRDVERGDTAPTYAAYKLLFSLDKQI